MESSEQDPSTPMNDGVPPNGPQENISHTDTLTIVGPNRSVYDHSLHVSNRESGQGIEVDLCDDKGGVNPSLNVDHVSHLELVNLLDSQIKLDEAELVIKRKRLELERLRRGLGHGEQNPISFTGQCDWQPPIPPPLQNNRTDSECAYTFSPNISLPRIEIDPFDGCPEEFVRFMHMFNVTIADRIVDDRQRLAYLIYYCRGNAKLAISHCSLLPPDKCYTTAIEILRTQFGMPHVVAHKVSKELYEGANLRVGDASDLQTLIRQMHTCQITLSQLGREADLNCTSNLLKIVRRFPRPMQREWAERVNDIRMSGKEPNFDNLIQFVSRCMSITNTEYGQLAYDHSKITENSNPKPKYRVTATHVVDRGLPCILCKVSHSLDQCPLFLDMKIDERWNTLRKHKRCYTCFKAGHRSNECFTKRPCSKRDCNKFHHPLLHADTVSNMLPPISNHVCGALGRYQRKIQLGFTPVVLSGPRGLVTTYALLDNGSDCTLVDKDVADKLGMNIKRSYTTISTLHGTKVIPCGKGSLSLASLDGIFRAQVEDVLIVDRLPIEHATKWTQLERWSHLHDLSLPILDGDHVGVLLGCDVPEAHWSLDQRVGTKREPFATKSPLGWVIRGPAGNTLNDKYHVNAIQGQDIGDLLTKLYNMEVMEPHNSEAPLESVEDNQALQIVELSANYDHGQYQLAVPWRSREPNLIDNLVLAEQRLAALKRRLLRDDTLKSRYFQTMREHIEKGHVSLAGNMSHRWYLPHHPVINPKKPEKLRIVFDCAATFKGISLNRALLQGPDWTTKLIGVLIRFRQHPVAVSADIKEMFLQVKLAHKDRWAFSFLWWAGDIETPPKVYEWNVHPFGAVSSPFCANYALRRTILDFTKDDTSLRTVHRNLYVDDYLASFQSIFEAKERVGKLRSLLLNGHFELVKWVSNHNEVLREIPSSSRMLSNPDQALTNHGVKTLGIAWRTQEDSFLFEVAHPREPFTRRSILAYIASVYDPLGLIAPIVLVGKLMLQELCRIKKGWDEELDTLVKQNWLNWSLGLQSLKEARIPRCITPIHNKAVRTELHVFSDASEMGYGVVSYLRSICGDESIHCHLIFGKARVAPLKAVTIPRLELVSALLAAKVSSQIKEELEITIDEVRLWTDSEIVLHYIANTSTRYATFVANRLQRIRELTSSNQWHFVSTRHNPADIASRGIQADSPKLPKWLCGPEWLIQPADKWPEFDVQTNISMDQLELKQSVMVIDSDGIHSWLLGYVERCPTWMRLLRSLVWLTRFKTYLLLKLKSKLDVSLMTGNIKTNELRQATIDTIRIVQNAAFGRYHSVGRDDGTLDIPSDLRRLKPVIVEGVLYLSGRTDPTGSKRLMILPCKGFATDLVIRYYHETSGHMGHTYVLAAVRRQFWVIKGMAAVRRVIGNCSKCWIRRAPPCQQVMAPLPISRISGGTYPFRFSGVDYFGPFTVTIGRKSYKRFGCLFTCLQTRAVHIEVSHELSSDSFIMALLRFISRRGSPDTIYSDNGTNFVGARLELKRLLTTLDHRRISNNLLTHNINWVFNPPYSSHRGGVWERMIRTIKRVLDVMVTEQSPTDEVLVTALAEVERIVNDRPLVPVYDDPSQPKALRPSDLLLLRPCSDLCNDEIPLRERYTRRWRQAQHLANLFWKRWFREYLPTLRLTQKWLSPHTNLKSGDLVLIQKTGTPRGYWPKGVVESTFPSADGMVRQVMVRTTQGSIRRDVRSLCLLEGALD